MPEEITMKRCLVTGCSGLIGSSLVRELSDLEEIYGISRKAPKTDVPRTFRHLPINLSENWDTGRLPRKLDAIVHLAQSEHYRDFPRHGADIFQINVASTSRLLDYAVQNGVKTFIISSTGGISEYQDNGANHDKTRQAYHDLGFYFKTKLCSEILANSYTPYINIIILRFFFVYGPGQKQTMLIPRLIHSVKNGIPITLHGSTGIKLNPTYVTDAARAIQKALFLNESQTLNVGGPDVLNMKQMGETIGLIFRKKPCFSVLNEGKPRHLVADIDKMSTVLSPPKVHFSEGIQSIWATT